MNNNIESGTALIVAPGTKLNHSDKGLTVGQGVTLSPASVGHVNLDGVRRMILAANTGRNGQRDALIIEALFNTCLRVGELLSVRYIDLKEDGGGWMVAAELEKIKGLNGKPRPRSMVSIPRSTADKLRLYVLENNLSREKPIFDIKRSRIWQIVDKAMVAANVEKPAHVGTVHALRHGGGIERMRISRNPVLIQKQLRHKGLAMSLRYLSTISDEESLKANQSYENNL
jgi:integrase